MQHGSIPVGGEVGDRVRVGAELTAVTSTSVGTQAAVTVAVEMDSGAKPACVAEWLLLLVG